MNIDEQLAAMEKARELWQAMYDIAAAKKNAERAEQGEGEGANPPAGNGKDVRLSVGKKKSASEPAVLGDESLFKATEVSGADGAKILNNLEKLAKKAEIFSLRQKNNFLKEVATAIGAKREGGSSEYATFKTTNGYIVTIRLTDHNATVSNFDYSGKDNGISIVISRKPNRGITNDGNAHIVEYYYPDKALRKADGNPYSQIVRSVEQVLYSGEYKDTTGLAEREEVNEENISGRQPSFSLGGRPRFREEVKAKKSDGNGPIRFSLNGDEKTLMGVHNISEDKLRKAITQGGLANPSLAVIDTENHMHTDYGEISIIPRSSMIDARTGRNAGTWTADAWTPTYPQVQKRMSTKGREKYWKDIRNAFSDETADLKSKTQMAFDSWIDNGLEPDRLAYWFLKESGVKPEHVLYDSGIPKEDVAAFRDVMGDNDAFYKLDEDGKRRVLELIAKSEGKSIDEMLAEYQDVRARRARELEEEGLKPFKERIIKGLLEEIDTYGVPFSLIRDYMYKMEQAEKTDGEVNANATISKAVERMKADGLEGDFKKWLDAKAQSYGIEEWLWNGTDNNGRDKWVRNTLENASRLMRKGGRNGAKSWSSIGSMVASVARHVTTTEQIRKVRNNLNTSLEEHEAFKDKWGLVMYDLSQKCYPADMWGGEARLQEALGKKDPAAYLKSEYGVELSKEDQEKIRTFIKEVRENYPTGYFETKFERPVMLDEFAVAVVPETASKDIVDALETAGLDVRTYDGTDEGRKAVALDAVKGRNDIMFSLGDQKTDERDKGTGDKQVQGLDGYTEDDVLGMVRSDIERKLEDAGVDGVTLKGMALHGSRMRGDARKDSDLDVVVEYEGGMPEDGLFNILNEEPLEIEGVRVDINPVTRGKSGTLEQYIERSRKYDDEIAIKREMDNANGVFEKADAAVKYDKQRRAEEQGQPMPSVEKVMRGDMKDYINQYTEEERERIREKEVENVVVDSTKEKLPKTREEALVVVKGMKKPFINKDQNKEITVSNNAVRHSSTQDHDFIDVRCMGAIDRIIRNAVMTGEEVPKPGREESINKTEVYYCPVNVDGTQYSARLVVNQYKNKGKVLDKFQMYDLSASKEKAGSSYAVHGGGTLLTPASEPVSAYKVKDLIHSTKENDRKILGLGKDFQPSFSISPEEDRDKYAVIDRLKDITGAKGYGINSAYTRGKTKLGETWEIRVSGHPAEPSNFEAKAWERGEEPADYILSIVVDEDFNGSKEHEPMTNDENRWQIVVNPNDELDWDYLKRSIERFKEDGDGSFVGLGRNDIRFSLDDGRKERSERDRTNYTIDRAVSFVTGKDVKTVREERRQRERERKERAKEIYENVLSGEMDDVTLQQINDYINEVTPNNPYGRRLSERLPQRVERALYGRTPENAVDALYSRICESAVAKDERTRPSGRRAVEEKKKELLTVWAKVTGNWHTDLSDFTDKKEPIGGGTDRKPTERERKNQ